MHGLRPAAAPQPALQRPAVCHLEHGALVPGQCSEQVTPSWHLLEEDLPKLGEKEPGSYSGTTKRMCPGIGGVQRCRTCPCSPPMLSYEHIPVPQTCTCLCTSAFLIAHSLFSGPHPFSTAVFLSDLLAPGTGLVSEPGLVKAERRQESSCPSAGMHSSTHLL